MTSTEPNVRAFAMAGWQDVAELFLAPKCCWGTLQLPYQSLDDTKAKLESPPTNMHRRELTVYPDSAAAIRPNEEHGFQREGMHMDFAFRDGKYGDALSMARLRGH